MRHEDYNLLYNGTDPSSLLPATWIDGGICNISMAGY